VFLSYPKPFLQSQQLFINELSAYLTEGGFLPRTLGVTDYDVDEPLTAIRRLMLECNGLLTIAFRRSNIITGVGNPSSDVGASEYQITNRWLTSPWCHIEPAMAFQIGLPILILREKGVIADGILEKGVTGTYLPEFDLSQPAENYLNSKEWKQIIAKWESYVRQVVENKGRPPKLF